MSERFPAELRLGLQFRNPDPFTAAAFEQHFGKKEGMIGRGSATGTDGAERAIVAYQEPSMSAPLVYTPSRGLVTFQIVGPAELVLVDNSLLPQVMDLADLNVSDLEWVEAEAKFILRKGGNTFKAMASDSAPVPRWAGKIFGHEMQPWGYRFVSTNVQEWSQPVSKLVPYYEFTHEPYTRDPSKVYTRFLVRESDYNAVRKQVDELDKKLTIIEGGGAF